MDFYLFTKSRWDEAPRLRHQIAQMLAANGHTLTFFERPTLLHRGRRVVDDKVTLVQTRWLMRGQLRVHRVLARLNNAVEKRELRRAIQGPPAIGVINFNYDYEFLRELFPQSKIVFVINDDFIDGALAPRETARQIGATAASSDQTIVTAYPLLDQVRGHTDHAELFLPWSRSGYNKPKSGLDRTDLIWWGYINDRIDEEAVRHVSQAGITMHFVGPVIDSAKIRRILALKGVVRHPSSQLKDLGAILDRCCASILPYERTFKQIGALTINNRGFELLSYGLPLLYTDLPALLQAPPDVIHRCATPQSFVEAHHSTRANFDLVQPSIENFLADHTPERRYAQLMGYFRTTH